MIDEKEKGIVVGGGGIGHGRTIQHLVNAIEKQGNTLIVVEPDVITVNSVRYKKVPQMKVKPHMAAILMMAEMFGDASQEKRQEMTEEALVKEFGLIQRKESQLSANARKQVVHTFNLTYTKID